MPSDTKAVQVAELIRQHHRAPIGRLLVVGCGKGKEAAALARALGCRVTGIDLKAEFDPAAAAAVELLRADATALPFDDASFDFVYSYHVLEHIPNYRAALAEIRRVLEPHGGFWIGTPNRTRMLAYISSKATPWQRVKWNAIDWGARLRGRFRNEYGAHAGFTSHELATELGRVFDHVEDATLDYFSTLYRRRAATVRLLHRSGLGAYVFPSVYFIGER